VTVDTTYFDRYFEERNLSQLRVPVRRGDRSESVSLGMVLEAIKAAPPVDRLAIKARLIRLDVEKNHALLLHYLRALGEAHLHGNIAAAASSI